MKQIIFIYFSILISLPSTGQNVGIGTMTPSEKLQVAGNIKSTGTVKANDIQFNSPKTYYYSVSGADFVAKNSNDEIHRESLTSGGAYFLTSTEGMVASAHLPHGATVTKMTAFFEDQGLAVDLMVRLRQNSGLLILASVISSGVSGQASLFDNTISNAVINNSTTAYVIDAIPIGGPWPGLNMVIHKVIIEYQLSQL